MKQNLWIWLYILTPIIVIGGLIWGAVAWEWYLAGRQVAIYHQQGVEMTQWDAFIGIVPAGQMKEKK